MLSLFKKDPRLADILSSFNKTIADLGKLADDNTDKIKVNEATIASLAANNNELTEEAIQSNNVKTKLEELIS